MSLLAPLAAAISVGSLALGMCAPNPNPTDGGCSLSVTSSRTTSNCSRVEQNDWRHRAVHHCDRPTGTNPNWQYGPWRNGNYEQSTAFVSCFDAPDSRHVQVQGDPD